LAVSPAAAPRPMRRGYNDPCANDGLATPGADTRCGRSQRRLGYPLWVNRRPPTRADNPAHPAFGRRYFPDSREYFFRLRKTALSSRQNASSISRLIGFGKPAGSGIFVPENVVGSELAAEFGTVFLLRNSYRKSSLIIDFLIPTGIWAVGPACARGARARRKPESAARIGYCVGSRQGCSRPKMAVSFSCVGLVSSQLTGAVTVGGQPSSL
jgi:hypothetical protein